MPESLTIIVTSDRYGNESVGLELERALLAEITDLTIDLRPMACFTEDDLIAIGAEADAILASTREAITRRVLANLPRTRVISRYGVGLDNVDLEAATDHDIVVTHFPGYCTAEVADHTMSLLLALNRRLVELDRDLHTGAWVKHGPATTNILRGPVPPLRELTLGIVGFGRIGRAVAERAKPFGLTILAADPYLDPATIVSAGVQATTLDDLLARSDFVTIHCPLTPETRGMIGAAQLARMKRTAFLINTARGPIVDLDALVATLERGDLAGAGLDVVYPEPLPAESPLYALPNVVLTPHSAYYSNRSVEVVRRETLQEAITVLRGRRPRTVANPAVLERVKLS